MIQSFADQGTEDVFNGVNSREARRTCPQQIWAVATRKLEQLDSPNFWMTCEFRLAID